MKGLCFALLLAESSTATRTRIDGVVRGPLSFCFGLNGKGMDKVPLQLLLNQIVDYSMPLYKSQSVELLGHDEHFEVGLRILRDVMHVRLIDDLQVDGT